MSNENTNTTTTSRKGRASYSSTTLHAKRDKRRKDAQLRQADHLKLTVKERIELAKSRQGESKREIARLTNLLATQKAPAVKPAPLTEAQKSAKAIKRAKDSVK